MTAIGRSPDAPNIRLEGTADGQSRLYQAAGDQIIHQVTQQDLRRPLPKVGIVQVSAGLAGLPRRPATAFVGRNAALTALRQALQDKTGPGVITQVVLGLGGVGKSELALQYAHRHHAEYRPVWWIDADSPAQVQAGLAALARALTSGIDSVAAEQATVDEAAAWALTWLTLHPGWLVIFDNLEEAADIEPYLARLTGGHVLITTRRDIGWQRLGITPLRLDLLERDASIALLADQLGTAATGQMAVLEELADQLGDLPLALHQAGAYITRTPRMTAARYLQLLKQTPARMYAAAPVGGDAARVVAKVWTVSHQRIAAVNPLAVHLLNLLACYAPDNLPCTLLNDPNNTDTADDVAVGEALALLASYSLITLTTDRDDHLTDEPQDLISVHRLIQATTLTQLTDDQRSTIRDQAAQLLQAALPDDPQRLVNWPVYRKLLSHARVVLPLDSPGLVQVRDYLEASGDRITALAIQRQMHTHRLHTQGPEHPETLTDRRNLAYFKGLVESAAAAREEFAVLLPMHERVLGAEHPHTLMTQVNLAYWTGEAGDAATARDQYAVLLPMHERVLGTEHPHTLTTRRNLAGWTGKAGDAATARDQYAILLPMHERVLGTEHPHTLTTRRNLAYWTGKAERAGSGAGDTFI